MHTTTTDSLMSPSAATTATTIPRGPPGVVTFRFQDEMAYVPLADSHEAAQTTAVRALAGLAGVDPRWLVFTITIRYRRSNERQEIAIAPAAWGYVTSRLVPYRLIDVRVVPPTPPPPPPPPPPPLAPPYASDSKSLAPPYPDSPPPGYPGSPQKHSGPARKNIPLPPHDQDYGYGYGYGFGWHDQTRARAPPPPQLDPSEMADQRSMGWSASSVRFARADTGGSFLERIKQNAFGIFPITWEDQPEQRRRRRGKGKTRRRREREREKEKMAELQDLQRHASGSGSGRSYVPSLV